MGPDNVNIHLNQNLWFLMITLFALGAAEYYHLCSLYAFALFLSVVASISFFITLTAYTINYLKWKMKD